MLQNLKLLDVVTACVLVAAFVWLGSTAVGIDPPGPPMVLPNMRVNDPMGPDGLPSQPACCTEDEPCALPECCINLSPNCPDPDDPPCCSEVPMPPGCPAEECCFNEAVCDDDPWLQNEPTISVAPWNPDVLIAAWNDRSYLTQSGTREDTGIGFAISRDGGGTWLRIERGPGYDPCEPNPAPTLTSGDAFTRVDLCDPVGPCELSQSALAGRSWGCSAQADPAAAIGAGGHLYLVGLSNGRSSAPFFARLQIDPLVADPLSGWETALVPVGATGSAVDKPFITADPDDETVYVHWSAASFPEGSVVLTISYGAGCDFFDPPQCPPEVPAGHQGVRLAYDESLDAVKWGSASGIAPDGEVHFIWRQAGSLLLLPNVIHRIRLRTLVSQGETLEFDPPLPPPGVTPCGNPQYEQYCERGIIHGQPGYENEAAGGYRPLNVHLVGKSTNFKVLVHPSIAVDPNDPLDRCKRGGYVYVAYAAEERPWEFDNYNDPSYCYPYDPTGPQGPDVAGRTIDSNIYVVHSRDGGTTWSAPVQVPTPTAALAPQTCGDDPGEDDVPCGKHYPFQFFPWIAVGDSGRVGVMYYDTSIDNDVSLPGIGNRCDDNVIYQIRFTYSLDGGVTWSTPGTVSEELSETQSFDPNDPFVFIGDYAGMTVTTGASGQGNFHPVWTDLREWTDAAREQPDKTEGDIYTATVTVEQPVYSMGDYDRDGDVDMADFKAISTCANAGLPIPPSCEILDFDRNNVIDKNDEVLFEQCRTGRAAGSSSGGDPGALEAMVTWTTQVMSTQERSVQADVMRQTAPSFDPIEAAEMESFADAIDPP